MTSTSPLAYPAEYYYPEFIDSRTDDPRVFPTARPPLTAAVDNGIGSSTKIPLSVHQVKETDAKKKPSNKKRSSTTLALDVATNQGLPDTDITESVKTDPKKNLLRDPGERNIPRLIVDDSLFRQTMIATTMGQYPPEFEEPEETKMPMKPTDGRKSVPNGYVNGDLRSKSKMSHDAMSAAAMRQKNLRFIPEEPPIDDYWKKEVHIDEEGGVSIEPLKYDRNAHDGPFGMTRQGSTIFYVSMAIISVLGAIFLILTGVFYAKNFPDSSANTAKLAGMGICGFAFYVGLQLILIGIWHQKYREENPKSLARKIDPHNDSTAKLKSSMENNAQYDPSYGQQMDYTSYGQQADYSPYGGYAAAPYAANVNEQMLLQQPGAATGAAYYDPVVWPSNVEFETPPDPRFFQPMEASYSQGTGYEQTTNVTPGYVPLATVVEPKPKKKINRVESTKTVAPEPPKAQFDNIFPNSTAEDANLPTLKKAPETSELLRTIAEMERNQTHTVGHGTSVGKSNNRINPGDGGTEITSLNTSTSRSRRGDHSRHRRRRHHRRSSYSSCSTCSDRSRSDFHSDVTATVRLRQASKSKMIPTRPTRAHTLSPSGGNRMKRRTTGIGTDFDSSYTVGVEDVPNVRDDREEQIPVVRRTIIVEPYPATPNTQIMLKPNAAKGGKGLSVETMDISGQNDRSQYQSTDTLSKRSKKKKTTTGKDNARKGDLRLEDVNEDDQRSTYNNTTERSKKKRSSQANAAYYQ